MRTWIIGGLIALAVLAAAAGLGAFGGGTPVEAAKVRKAPVQEFVDERGKTRLPQVYAITMPVNGRVEAISLVEGAPVHKGQVVAQLVPLDLKLSHDAAAAAISRLDASIVENDDVSVEQTSLAQALKIVESVE